MEHPLKLDPRFPPSDPARVSLLMALDWPDPADAKAARGNPDRYFGLFTTQGRPLTDAERNLLGASNVNDFAVMDQLMHEEMRIIQERADLSRRMTNMLQRYAFHDGETIDQVRARMSPADRAEVDRLSDILHPDGYLWLDEI